MLGIARSYDIACGICFCHDTPVGTCGILVPSQNTVFTNQRQNIRLGDIIITFCGHISIVTTASGLAYASKINIARSTDIVTGCMIGTIVTSSTNVFTT